MIRTATLQDIPRLVELFNSSDYLLGCANDRYTPDDLRQYLSGGTRRIYVYEHGGAVDGAVYLELLPICQEIHIFVLVVDKACQGKGIGQKLLDHVDELAKKHHVILISSFTETDNARMRHVFEKNGFEKGKEFLYYHKDLPFASQGDAFPTHEDP